MAILIAGSCSNRVEGPAQLVVLNGSILTVDKNLSVAEAVAIRDGKFVAIGKNRKIRSYIDKNTRIIDAGGRTVVPGLHESHNHVSGAVRGELSAGRPFRQLNSIKDIQEYARQQVQETTGGEWVRLPRADVTRIRDGRIPIPAELDEAAPDHPVVFIWQYANLQIQILNSTAMKEAGITKNTPVSERGKIVLGEDGNPTGRLENCPELTRKFLPQKDYTEEEYMDGLERLLNNYNKVGITSVHDRGANPDVYRIFRKMHENGRLAVRATLTMRMGGLDGSVEKTEEALRRFNLNFRDGDDHVRVGPAKFSMDGGILYGTAFMRKPFGESAFELYGIDDPEYRGVANFTTENLTNILYAGQKSGWQISAHVTGDAGVDAILDAIEAANKRLDGSTKVDRFIFNHAYFPSKETAERVTRLNAGIDTQPAWYYLDGDALLKALGEERTSRLIGLQTWLDGGTRVAINSDHMQGFDPNTSLNPFNPFLTMYTAVARRTTGNKIIGPEYRVSREDALRMMTIEAAWLDFDEDLKGSIEVGKLADLAILSNDFLNCEEEAIKDILSLVTVVGGEVVYKSDDFREAGL